VTLSNKADSEFFKKSADERMNSKNSPELCVMSKLAQLAGCKGDRIKDNEPLEAFFERALWRFRAFQQGHTNVYGTRTRKYRLNLTQLTQIFWDSLDL